MLVALRNACCPPPAPTPWGPPRPTAARRVPAPDTAGRRRRRSDTAGAEHKETHPRPRRGPPRTGRRRRLVYAPAATTTTYTPARDSSIRRISAPARTTQRRSTRGSGARFSRRRGARARSAPAEASLGRGGWGCGCGRIRHRGHAAWAQRSRAAGRAALLLFLAAWRAGEGILADIRFTCDRDHG